MENDEIRTTLENETARLTAMRDDLRSSADLDQPEDTAPGGEVSPMGNHPADVATDQQYREIDLSMVEQIDAELSEVEDALEKLDNGTYGICEAGGEQIEADRLEALPATRLCKLHAGTDANTGITNETSPL